MNHRTLAAGLTFIFATGGLVACWLVGQQSPNGIYEAWIQLGKMSIAAFIAVAPAVAYIRGAIHHE